MKVLVCKECASTEDYPTGSTIGDDDDRQKLRKKHEKHDISVSSFEVALLRVLYRLTWTLEETR
jgi:hypothetical protein